mmetsp:Transcript_19077/g.42097  ORF Transcript_19077/g.42097 Transcript_19077/m.42097 type:complete len:268 (-) Transcript_19077:353-1156(-)
MKRQGGNLFTKGFLRCFLRFLSFRLPLSGARSASSSLVAAVASPPPAAPQLRLVSSPLAVFLGLDWAFLLVQRAGLLAATFPDHWCLLLDLSRLVGSLHQLFWDLLSSNLQGSDSGLGQLGVQVTLVRKHYLHGLLIKGGLVELHALLGKGRGVHHGLGLGKDDHTLFHQVLLLPLHHLRGASFFELHQGKAFPVIVLVHAKGFHVSKLLAKEPHIFFRRLLGQARDMHSSQSLVLLCLFEAPEVFGLDAFGLRCGRCQLLFLLFGH